MLTVFGDKHGMGIAKGATTYTPTCTPMDRIMKHIATATIRLPVTVLLTLEPNANGELATIISTKLSNVQKDFSEEEVFNALEADDQLDILEIHQ